MQRLVHSLALNLIPSGIREERFARRFRQELRVRRERGARKREEQCRSEKPESHLFIPMSLRLKIRLPPMFCPARVLFLLTHGPCSSFFSSPLFVCLTRTGTTGTGSDGWRCSPPLCHIIVAAACRVQTEYIVCQSEKGFKLWLFSIK